MTEDEARVQSQAEQGEPTEQVKADPDPSVAGASPPPEPNDSEKNELEYWKTQYDFQKHLMTLSLAFAAGLAALLAGFLRVRGRGP